MSKLNNLDKESVKLIADARAKAVDLAQAAQAAMKDAKIAELEFKNAIQQVYIDKGLGPRCNIDLGTGVITWPEAAENQEEIPESVKEIKTERKVRPVKGTK